MLRIIAVFFKITQFIRLTIIATPSKLTKTRVLNVKKISYPVKIILKFVYF